MRKWMCLVVVLCSWNALSADHPTTTRPDPTKRTAWASGQRVYRDYCAACHGEKGDGNGPAAAACKQKPADLRMLATHNEGKFPYKYFYSMMQFGTLLPTPAHGSSDMPVWMPLFYPVDQSHKAIAEQRMRDIAGYIASLQVK
jgi:mono/diheme cytochrome c family protein